MFGWWRRKTDGLVWRDYVRTTIKLRREERARKLNEIKQLAADGARAAGQKGLAAGRDGVSAGGSAMVRTIRWFRTLVGQGTARLLSLAPASWRAATSALQGALPTQRFGLPTRLPVFSTHTKIALMFGTLGLLAATSAYLQLQQSGLSWSTTLAIIVSVVLLGLSLVPAFKRAAQQPMVSGNRWSYRALGIAAFAASVCGAGLWAWQSGSLSRASSALTAMIPSMPTVSITRLPDLEGRAQVITGDTIRIDRRIVQFVGLEAPELTQVCRDKRKRAWRCGQRARSALRRLVRRRTILCTDVTKTSGGRYQAACTAGGRDLGEQLVEKGYAFAEDGLFQSYADAEAAARKAKRGMWQGEVQRPAEFRASRWAKASRSAPDGCPIKGRVVRKSKIYVLPWALDYRQVRVRIKRGERWFCSEAEATNAGFKPATTG